MYCAKQILKKNNKKYSTFCLKNKIKLHHYNIHQHPITLHTYKHYTTKNQQIRLAHIIHQKENPSGR